MYTLLRFIKEQRLAGKIYKADLFLMPNQYTNVNEYSVRIKHFGSELFISADGVFCNLEPHQPHKKVYGHIQSTSTNTLDLDELANKAKEAVKAHQARLANIDSDHY